MDMKKRLEFAVSAAKEAGRFTLEYFDRPGLRVDRKGDGTPVTDADRGAEKLLRQRITEMFPDDAILGEEFPLCREPAGCAGSSTRSTEQSRSSTPCRSTRR